MEYLLERNPLLQEARICHGSLSDRPHNVLCRELRGLSCLNTLELGGVMTREAWALITANPVSNLTLALQGTVAETPDLARITKLTLHLRWTATKSEPGYDMSLFRLTNLRFLRHEGRVYDRNGLSRLARLHTMEFSAVSLKRADMAIVASKCRALTRLMLDQCYNLKSDYFNPCVMGRNPYSLLQELAIIPHPSDAQAFKPKFSDLKHLNIQRLILEPDAVITREYFEKLL
ncbi:MAG: hypothetical protein JSR72_23725 [Proteobacteria bacterium]|nr:hypothetical protein [Pseudomonadota bacterium]